MSDRLYREAAMYEADEGTGSMEQGAVRLWVMLVERCQCKGRDHHPTWRNGKDRSDGFLPDCQEFVDAALKGDDDG